MPVLRKARTPVGALDKMVEKPPCRLGTLSNVASLTSVSTTFGGGTLAKGDRALLAGQSTASQNGIYVAGAVSGGNTSLRRASDFDEGDEVGLETMVSVQAGTLAGKRYRVTATGTVGSSTITFTEMAGVSLTTATATNGGAGNAGKALALDVDGKAAGQVLETDGAKLDVLPPSMANPGAIGGGTPAAGAFTTVSASGVLSANGGATVAGATPAAAADKVGLGVADVEGATTAAEERTYEGGGKERRRMASASGDLDILRWSQSVADDGTINLGALPTNGGRVTINSRDEGAVFGIHSDGTVTSLHYTTNTSNADDDTKLCVFSGGGNLTAKNRLGGARWLIITYERD